jgi:glycolate oxidase FAD binding subunit
MLLLNPTAANAIAPQVASSVPTAGTLMLLNYEGMEEAVARQSADLARICQGQGAAAVHRCTGETQAELQRRLTILYPCSHHHPAAEPSLLARLGTLPSHVPDLLAAITRLLGPLTSRTLIAGDCGVGQVQLGMPWSLDEADAIGTSHLRILRELPQLVAAEGGYMVIESVPSSSKESLDVWGPPPAHFTLLKALKQTFDPERILNPGRFLGDL